LAARRQKTTSRVGNKQKKLLAMMEEETVIDDPGAKNARLLAYKKIEVGKQLVCHILTFVVLVVSAICTETLNCGFQIYPSLHK
jgi:hypothetical protein